MELLDTLEIVDESEEPELAEPVVEPLVKGLLEFATEFAAAELTVAELLVDDEAVDDNDEVLELTVLDVNTLPPDDEAEMEDDNVDDVLDVVMELVVILDGL